MSEEIEIAAWYKKHEKKMLKEGTYVNPCEGCSGEDCACCSFGRGY